MWVAVTFDLVDPSYPAPSRVNSRLYQSRFQLTPVSDQQLVTKSFLGCLNGFYEPSKQIGLTRLAWRLLFVGSSSFGRWHMMLCLRRVSIQRAHFKIIIVGAKCTLIFHLRKKHAENAAAFDERYDPTKLVTFRRVLDDFRREVVTSTWVQLNRLSCRYAIQYFHQTKALSGHKWRRQAWTECICVIGVEALISAATRGIQSKHPTEPKATFASASNTFRLAETFISADRNNLAGSTSTKREACTRQT